MPPHSLKVQTCEVWREMTWSIPGACRKDWEKQTIKVWLIMRLQVHPQGDGMSFLMPPSLGLFQLGAMGPSGLTLHLKKMFQKKRFIIRKVVWSWLPKPYGFSLASLMEIGKEPRVKGHISVSHVGLLAALPCLDKSQPWQSPSFWPHPQRLLLTQNRWPHSAGN